VDTIPIYREGDDSGSRQQVLDSLRQGRLVAIAPEWGNDAHRDATGLRPLTHGVASIARQFFVLNRSALTIVPVGLTDPKRPFWGKVRVRVGAPYHGMSDVHYPALFGDEPPGIDERREAYRRFTADLTRRLRELIRMPAVCQGT
jgi:1-acyl-sn-glycerol-3-phosphate acyltransferase